MYKPTQRARWRNSQCVCVCVCVNVYVDVKRYLCLVTLQRTPGVARRDDSRWLQIKNALTNDNSKDAAKAGVTLEAALKNLDKSLLTPEEKKVYEDVAEDARMHAQHIRENAGNIGHQREHFDMLSKDMYDLVKAFGSSQVLYKDFCPMYNDKKGAFWLSETKEIKNPYLGKKMPTCGSVKEEIK